MKKTLILGASPNPERYANMAARRLVENGHDIVNIGLRKGQAGGVAIESAASIYTDIDTITLYLNTELQRHYYDYILATKPKRVIFNPGTENPELANLLKENGIVATEACTLVLLSTGQY